MTDPTVGSRRVPSLARGVWILVVLGVVALGLAGRSQAQGPQAPTGAAQPDTVRQLEVLVARDSTNYQNLYRLGVAYMDRDRALEAIRIFRRCTQLRPKEVKAWVNLGAAQDAVGHGGDARVSYREALVLDPADQIALCRLTASLYASGMRSAAMDTLRLTLKKHPRSYCAYFTLGVAFADAQIFKEAIRAWEKVIEHAPNTPEALSARESIATLREMMGPQSQ